MQSADEPGKITVMAKPDYIPNREDATQLVPLGTIENSPAIYRWESDRTKPLRPVGTRTWDERTGAMRRVNARNREGKVRRFGDIIVYCAVAALVVAFVVVMRERYSESRELVGRFRGHEDRFLVINGLKTAPDASPYITGKVLVVDKSEGKIDFDLQMQLPDAIRANAPDEVRTVIWLNFHREKVGHYVADPRRGSTDKGLDAERQWCEADVIDLVAGQFVGRLHIPGEMPPERTSGGDTVGSKPRKEIVGHIEMLPIRDPK